MYPFLPPLLSPLLWKRFFTNQFIVNIKQSEQLISWKVETDACEVLPPGPQIADTPIPAHVGPRINHHNLVIWWVPLLIRKNLKPFCRVKDFWAVLLYFNESKTIPSTWMGNSASHTFPPGHHILSYGWAHKMGCSSWWRGFYMFFFFFLGWRVLHVIDRMNRNSSNGGFLLYHFCCRLNHWATPNGQPRLMVEVPRHPRALGITLS